MENYQVITYHSVCKECGGRWSKDLKMNEPYIHNTTQIGKNLKIKEGSKIWGFCNILNDVTIGKDTQIGAYTEIKSGVTIGDYCRFQSYVFIPEGITIGDNVFIAPRVTFTNDKYPSVESAIDNSWNLEKTIIEDFARIGAGSIILPGINIGEYAFIGAGSVVTKSVKPHTLVYGNPAKFIKFIEK